MNEQNIVDNTLEWDDELESVGGGEPSDDGLF